MNLTHLQSFMLVAKMHSFSAASEQLGASKGLVSRHVNPLKMKWVVNYSTELLGEYQ